MKQKLFILFIVAVLLACIIVGIVEFNMIYLISTWDWSSLTKVHTTTPKHPSLFVSGFLACITALIVGSVLYVVSPFCRRWIKDFFYMNY